jgi:hypothetical protein
MLLSGGSPNIGHNDDLIDLNGDSSWDLSSSNMHDNNSNMASGGSSKPMTEEEQKISIALQAIYALLINMGYFLGENCNQC